jgi:hypothetical protein
MGIAAAVLALLCVVSGCEGGGGDGAPAQTATVQGQCYDAGSPTVTVPNAVVTETSTSLSATCDVAGNFTLGGLPAGLLTLQVTAPSRVAYKPTTVAVQATLGQVTHIEVGLVPSGLADPAQVIISPRSLTVQTGISRQFQATVKDASGNPISIYPTWTVSSNIGQISRLGLLTASNTTGQPIAGQIIATAGLATDSVPVTVNPPGPPVVTNFVISPLTLGHNGGTVSISAQVEDGDGVADRGIPPGPVLAPRPPTLPAPPGYDGTPDIVATVSLRRLATSTEVLIPLLTGDAQFGYYQTTYAVPANSAPTGPTGDQPAEQYDAYLTASDALGVSSTPTSPLVLTVQGVSAPPPPPF